MRDVLRLVLARSEQNTPVHSRHFNVNICLAGVEFAGSRNGIRSSVNGSVDGESSLGNISSVFRVIQRNIGLREVASLLVQPK